MIHDPMDMGRSDALSTGLSSADAAARLGRDGPNALPELRSSGWYRLLLEVLREPMIGLLLAGALLYALMGEPADGALLLVCVGFVVTLTVVQERRTERALEALGGLASPRALVLRDGVERRIAARELVVGDLVLLNEGDRVPADALLRQSALLTVDESLLTGESVPVRKRASLEASMLQRPGGDDHPGLYSGTLVTAGHGLCEVIAIGAATELAAISRSLGAVTPEITPLQRETRRVVRVLAVAGLLACVLVGITYALTRGADVAAWREGGLAGIAMAMSMIPEEFPVVLTVFLALGAWRIGRHQVLTRRMPAIEALGSATVLCVDKTGTLTENRMALTRLRCADREYELAVLEQLPTSIAAAEVEARVANLASQRLDQEVQNRLSDAEGEFQTRWLMPLRNMGLDPTPVDFETTDQRLIVRYRIAAIHQLAAHTPRPQAPTNSWMSVQLHESAINNTLDQLGIGGRKLTVQELCDELSKKFGRPSPPLPEDVPEDMTVTLAQRDGIRVRCDGGKLRLTLRVAELSQNRHSKWKNFMVQTTYVPSPDQRNANLVRDGIIELSSEGRGVGNQFALRTIFSKVLSKNRTISLINHSMAQQPEFADLMINQFVLSDGWIGIAMAPKPNTARIPYRRSIH